MSEFRRHYNKYTKRRARSIGSECIRQVLNDPAAALFMLDKDKSDRSWSRIQTEFDTDMLERRPSNLASRELGIHTEAIFEVSSGTISCIDSGQDLQTILDSSVEAAKNDAGTTYGDYGLERERARQTEVAQILAWLENGGKGAVLKSSLCPPTSELDVLGARRLNFRPDRLMSVNTLYRFQDSMLYVDYFTLEDHDLEMQQEILDSLGCGAAQASTMSELEQLHQTLVANPLAHIYETVRQRSGKVLDEHKLATARGLNLRLIKECQKSELAGAVTAALVEECQKLGISFENGAFSRESSRSILSTYRSVSAPHFIYRPGNTLSGGSHDIETEVYSASTQAVQREIVYAGDCPDSSSAASSIVTTSDTGFGAGSGAFESIYSFRQRANMNELRSRLKGYGSCRSCGVCTGLFGCGIFCGNCNRIWCDSYEQSLGRSMLTARQVQEKRGLSYKKRVAA